MCATLGRRQVQIFFALLSSVALRFDTDLPTASNNIDGLLSVLTFLPVVLTFYLDSPLHTYVNEALRQQSISAVVIAVVQERAEPIVRLVRARGAGR